MPASAAIYRFDLILLSGLRFRHPDRAVRLRLLRRRRRRLARVFRPFGRYFSGLHGFLRRASAAAETAQGHGAARRQQNRKQVKPVLHTVTLQYSHPNLPDGHKRRSQAFQLHDRYGICRSAENRLRRILYNRFLQKDNIFSGVTPVIVVRSSFVRISLPVSPSFC